MGNKQKLLEDLNDMSWHGDNFQRVIADLKGAPEYWVTE